MNHSKKELSALKQAMLTKLEEANLVGGRLLAGCCTQGCCGEEEGGGLGTHTRAADGSADAPKS
ncbi:hypothetical protein [Kordia sp.]|uniref:hypothetical protein n=1 Tax=Kordia sp. TaxID=1965332 RepID=UPI003B5A5B34